jgi:hypothetical protein
VTRLSFVALGVVVVGCRSTAPAAKATGEDAAATTTSSPGTPSVVASASAAPATSVAAPPASLDVTSPADYTEPTGPGYVVAMPAFGALVNAPDRPEDAASPMAPLGGWMGARIRKARAGERELVRVPLFNMAPCGCPCFDTFLGDHVDTMCESAGIALHPLYEAPAVALGYNVVAIAEGYFDGKEITEERSSMVGPERFDELRVLRTRPPAAYVPKEAGAGDGGDDDEAPPIARADDRAVVLAVGDQAGLEVPAPADGRTFLLLEGSTPLAGGEKAFRSARDRADKLRARFPHVELVDSRRVPGLFCCNYVVVLDRFATQHEASVAAAGAAKLGVTASSRRGW